MSTPDANLSQTPEDQAWDRYVESGLSVRSNPNAGLDDLLAKVDPARKSASGRLQAASGRRTAVSRTKMPRVSARVSGRSRQQHSVNPMMWILAAACVMLVAGLALMNRSGAPTETVVATLIAADAGTLVLRGDKRIPVKQGQSILDGDEVITAATASAAIEYIDATRMNVNVDSAIALQADSGSGKRADLRRGTVSASVTKQPEGRPFVLRSPNAEAKVLGTKFILALSSGGTRLDVSEGQVRLTRTADGAHADVPAGHYAIAAAGEELIAKSLKPEIPAAPKVREVLFIHRDNTTDSLAMKRLEKLGFKVLQKSDSAATTEDAEGKALVVISERVSTVVVGSKFRDVKVPVLLWECGLYGEMKMARGGGGNLKVPGKLVIQNPKHPLAAGLFGTVQITAGAETFAAITSGSLTGANVIASFESARNQVAIFCYEAGDQMNGMAAPARRTGFFLYGNVEAQLNAEGWALFEAAVKWCAESQRKD